MAMASRGRIWDEASSPAAAELARAYEAAWRSRPNAPPEPLHYLPLEPERGPGALLALLRADLALRREAGEPVRVEWYAERYAGLDDDVLVALLYEEFCLREEAGESPRPAEYEARFPKLAPQLGEILEIHEWVGSTESWSLAGPAPGGPFPEVGHNIDGFRLVEELGRGAFARVYLAEEQGLADRPVALKVARRWSAEPQTLARLQHTHIVPVYSYRTDPDTGLHLLCMPYFGRVTLAAMVADPRYASARSGMDLLGLLDALRPASETPSPRAEGRTALAGRTIGQAVAWWGARLAEALHHAHEQGILHSDVKPSNVLITVDAIPMLLDFNLSHAAPDGRPHEAPFVLGGTLAYMAPEHLRAVANQATGAVDARADVYGLGVVLFEVLACRPFPASVEGRPGEALHTLIAHRRHGPPWERLRQHDVPAPLEAVIRKCLTHDPAARYQTAAQLAADLHAVADDGPLRYARESEPARTLRWASRNRVRLALAAAIGLSVLGATAALFHAQAEAHRRDMLVRECYHEGVQAEADGQFAVAATLFARAVELAQDRPSLRALGAEAERHRRDALATDRIRHTADALFEQLEPLRFRLISRTALDTIAPELKRVLAPFHVLGGKDWSRLPDLDRLDPARRARLLDEVNELLFLWVFASEPQDDDERRLTLAVCDQARRFAEPREPWDRLRARLDPQGDPGAGVTGRVQALTRAAQARRDFQCGLLAMLENDHVQGLRLLERSASIDPNDFWHQFALAVHCERLGETDRALSHYDQALALRPDSGWVHFNRALLYKDHKRAWDQALADLAEARQHSAGLDPHAIRLATGQIAEQLGDFRAALAAFNAVVASGTAGEPVRSARLSRARLWAALNDTDAARADYDAVLQDDPRDLDAAVGRALLDLGLGRPAEAEAALTRLLDERPQRPRPSSLLMARAQARLARERPALAQDDAAELLGQGATPARLRLWTRVALALGRDRELGQLQPDDIDRLPLGGPGLRRDLRAAADRLTARARGEEALPALLTRAVVQSALDRHDSALADADQAVALRPDSAHPRLIRARVRRRAGDRSGALADVQHAIALDPDDSRLLALRGVLHLDAGMPAQALADLEFALLRGADGPAHAAKARAWHQLGQFLKAADEWNLALADDPEDSAALLGRARAFVRLGQWDNALADLEDALDRSPGERRTRAGIVLTYAAILPARPSRLRRVLALVQQAAVDGLRTESDRR